MAEAQKHQRPLSEVIHELLADRLDRAETPEAQAAWIRLATWMRDRIEELLHRYPYPQPQYFDGLWDEIRDRPEFHEIEEGGLRTLKDHFESVRAQIFKQRIRLGHITPITEHVTLDNPGAEHDLKQARAFLPSDPEEAQRLAISAFDKTTAAGETISAENADLAWQLGHTFSDLGDGDYMQRAYTRAWNIYVDLLPTVEDIDLLIVMSARATVLKAIFQEADLLIAVIKKRIEKENSVDALLRIAEDPELMDDVPLKRKVVEKAFDTASDYEACLRVGKEAEEQFHFPDIAINVYHKAADYVRHDDEKLTGLVNRLRALGAHTIANLVEDILRILVPPVPTIFPPLRFNTAMIGYGRHTVEIKGEALPVAGLETHDVWIHKIGYQEWDCLPKGEGQNSFRAHLEEGEYEIRAAYAKEGIPRQGEILVLHVVQEENFTDSDRVAHPKAKSIKPTKEGLLRVRVRLDHEFRPERTRALKSSNDGGTTWQDLLYRAHEGEVEITVEPGSRFCVRAIGDVYAEADSDILEIPALFSLVSPASMTATLGQTRVPVDLIIHDRQPSDELWYSLDGGKTWTEYLQPGDRIHLEAPVPAVVYVRCRNDKDPLRNQFAPPVEVRLPLSPRVEPPAPAPLLAPSASALALEPQAAPRVPMAPVISPEGPDDIGYAAFFESLPGEHVLDDEERVRIREEGWGRGEAPDDDDEDWGDLVDPAGAKKKKK